MWTLNKTVYIMIKAAPSKQQTEQGIWLFLKVPSQLQTDMVSQPNQREIEARLNEFFAALDAKA